MHPTHTEVATGSETFTILTAPIDIGKAKDLALRGQMLDERHYTLMLDETGIAMTPDGQVLCILLKNQFQPELLEAVRPIARKVACQPVAGGNRRDAAGAGKAQRKRKNGSLSKITGVPGLEDLSDEDYQRLKSATSGTFGFHPRTVRGGQVYPCRFTAYSGALPSELMLMAELAKEVSEAFRCSHVYDRWETQFKKASQTPAFVLKTHDGLTPFTTITCNNNWRTAAHVDQGDLKEGFGAMCCFGDFDGCDLVFPRYRVAVRYREGDILLADVANQVHGDTPLLNPDGTVPKSGEEPERLVCDFYYEENMEQCLNSLEEEMEFVSTWKPGDLIYPKKKKS
jgi:2-oxoglutarate-Fe(II)-dependent dioxygenase family protein